MNSNLHSSAGGDIAPGVFLKYSMFSIIMSVVLGFNIKTIFKFILSKSNQNGSYQIANDIKVDFLSNQSRQKKVGTARP